MTYFVNTEQGCKASVNTRYLSSRYEIYQISSTYSASLHVNFLSAFRSINQSIFRDFYLLLNETKTVENHAICPFQCFFEKVNSKTTKSTKIFSTLHRENSSYRTFLFPQPKDTPKVLLEVQKVSENCPCLSQSVQTFS